MTFLSNLVMVSALAGLAFWLYRFWRGLVPKWLPPELATAKLSHVERDLFAKVPFKVAGRPDRVYRLGDGKHVPVEYKTRDRFSVYETDVAQLSLQAWLLRKNGHETADFGFAVVNNRQTGEDKALRVPLRDDAFCERMVERYVALIEGRALARRNRGPKCNTCGHRPVCE
jgi:CRISPR/Cas system-associated exonuclease Cas4 (RecB family)